MTAPSAWRATLPVSSVSVSPPHSIDTFFTSNIWFPSPAGPSAGRALQFRPVRPGRVWAVLHPFLAKPSPACDSSHNSFRPALVQSYPQRHRRRRRRGPFFLPLEKDGLSTTHPPTPKPNNP